MNPNQKLVRYLLIACLIVGIALAVGAGYLYQTIYADNVTVDEPIELKIPRDAQFEDVLYILEAKSVLKNIKSFKWVAEKMNYPNKIRSGNYLIEPNFSNRTLITKLRGGLQTPVQVRFNNLRTKNDLANAVALQLDFEADDLLKILTDSTYLHKIGYNEDNIMTLFLPNTYEMYWNASAQKFVDKMIDAHKFYWTSERIKKALNLGLTPEQVYILASIVEKEAIFNSEKPTIAGVYLNRIKKGMRLQADPTVIFATGNFGIRRVLNRHLKIDSPYNTYKYKGLPPGPICLPDLSTIEAVLNAEKHRYIFFCAKPTLDGYHSFAITNAQHEQNARAYRNALNQRKIYQ